MLEKYWFNVPKSVLLSDLLYFGAELHYLSFTFVLTGTFPVKNENFESENRWISALINESFYSLLIKWSSCFYQLIQLSNTFLHSMLGALLFSAMQPQSTLQHGGGGIQTLVLRSTICVILLCTVGGTILWNIKTIQTMLKITKNNYDSKLEGVYLIYCLPIHLLSFFNFT